MTLPNTRLKLSAPALNASAGRLEIGRGSIPFVNTSNSRRSLSAIR